MSDTDSVESLLVSIADLQEVERQLLDKLSTTTTTEEANTIVTKINQFANMRKNLYAAIAKQNENTLQSVESNLATLNQQKAAVDIMERQLNELKKKQSDLQDDKNNHVRLVQINTYFAERYEAHGQLMKSLLYTLVPLVVLAYLKNKQWLVGIFFYIPFLAVSAIGGYYFWHQLYSVYMRDNMVYSEYDWNYDRSEVLPANDSKYHPDSSTSGAGSSGGGGYCMNNSCCADGTIWDPTKLKCVPIK